ncbi:6509_t:CDS:1, partial [Dentiscutata erythropus]
SQRQQSLPQEYEPSFETSDSEFDKYMDKEAIVKPGDSYQSKDKEKINAELEEIIEEDNDEYIELDSRVEKGEEEVEQVEEEETEQAEEPEKETEQVDDDIDAEDINECDDATPVDDKDDFEIDEEEDEDKKIEEDEYGYESKPTTT